MNEVILVAFETIDIEGMIGGFPKDACDPKRFLEDMGNICLSIVPFSGKHLTKSAFEPVHDDSKVALEYPESVKIDLLLSSLSVGETSKVSIVPISNSPVGLSGETMVADIGLSLHRGMWDGSMVLVSSLGRANLVGRGLSRPASSPIKLNGSVD